MASLLYEILSVTKPFKDVTDEDGGAKTLQSCDFPRQRQGSTELVADLLGME